MALRGVKPKAVEKRLKALFFGPAGVGKTTAAIQFPRPYLIDTERGAENPQYVAFLDKSHGAYFFTADFSEMLTEVRSLLTEKHEYRTLIIDPLTVVYNDLVDKAADSLADESKGLDGTEFGRHKAKADRKLKHLLNLLLRLDMNVIITSHAKTLWKKEGERLLDLGQTFDCYAKLDYLFDLVFEVQQRGQERVGITRKTRVEAFALGEAFPFNYPAIADKYGRAVLEREAQAQELATPDQVLELRHLVEVLRIEDEIVEKWLDKARADTFAEMPRDAALKCIDFCLSRVKAQPVPVEEPKADKRTRGAA